MPVLPTPHACANCTIADQAEVVGSTELFLRRLRGDVLKPGSVDYVFFMKTTDHCNGNLRQALKL